MGKKKLRNKYISKGRGKSVDRKLMNSIRKDRPDSDRLVAVLDVWMKGGNPWITISNPNKAETNKRFIRVRMNDHKRGTFKEHVDGRVEEKKKQTKK